MTQSPRQRRPQVIIEAPEVSERDRDDSLLSPRSPSAATGGAALRVYGGHVPVNLDRSNSFVASGESNDGPFANFAISVLQVTDDDAGITRRATGDSAPLADVDDVDEVLLFSPEMFSAAAPQGDAGASENATEPGSQEAIADGSRAEEGRAPVERRGRRALPYVALPLHRKPMILPRAAGYPFFPWPSFPSIFRGLAGLLMCRPPLQLRTLPPRGSRLPDRSPQLQHLGTHGIDDEDADEDTVPVVFAPLPLQAALAALVVAASVLHFAAPDAIGVELQWSSGRVEVVEALFPLVLFLLALLCRSVAHSRGIDLRDLSPHHALHPGHSAALMQYVFDLERRKVRGLAASSASSRAKRGLSFRRKTANKLMRLLQEEDEAQAASRHRNGAGGAFSDNRSTIGALLYAEMITSNASLMATAETRAVPVGVSMGLPALVALSPLAGRMSVGEAPWGGGSLPELALMLFGTLLSACAAHTVAGVVSAHHESLRYHEICVSRVTHALPGALQATIPSSALFAAAGAAATAGAAHFPAVPFTSVGNIMAWHRLRWALGAPPHTLTSFGTICFESTALVATTFIALSIVSDFTSGGGVVTGAGSGIATALAFAIPAMTTSLLRTPLHINNLLRRHALIIGEIALHSLGVEAHRAQQRAAAAHTAQQAGRGNPLGTEAAAADRRHREGDDVEGSGTSSLNSRGGSSEGRASELDAELEQQVNLRRALRDIAFALPHHTVMHRFMGIAVTPPVLLAFLTLYIVFAVLSVHLVVARFV